METSTRFNIGRCVSRELFIQKNVSLFLDPASGNVGLLRCCHATFEVNNSETF